MPIDTIRNRRHADEPDYDPEPPGLRPRRLPEALPAPPLPPAPAEGTTPGPAAPATAAPARGFEPAAGHTAAPAQPPADAPALRASERAAGDGGVPPENETPEPREWFGNVLRLPVVAVAAAPSAAAAPVVEGTSTATTAAAPAAATLSAPTPTPTAGPQEIALFELMLADPLNRELSAALGGNTSAPAGSPAAQTLIERYGADLAGRLTQHAQAVEAVRERFAQALLDAAREPSGQGPGWAEVPVEGPLREDGPSTTRRFDPATFARAWAQGATLEQRAFAAFGLAEGPWAASSSGHPNREPREVYTSSTGLRLSLPQGDAGQRGPFGQFGAFTADLARDDQLLRLDLRRPADLPELHNPAAVWFDPRLGWVTPIDNQVYRPSTLDRAAPIVFAAVAAWAVGPYAAQLGASAGAAAGGSAFVSGAVQAGVMAAAGSTAAQLASAGTLDFKQLLRSTLSGALTGGVLNGLGITQGLQSASFATRVMALTGQATVQGAIQEVMGGRFKDGFSTGLATGLANEVMQALDASIKAAGLSPAQTSAMQLLRQATGSAIRALAGPGDAQQAFALDFLNSLVGDGLNTATRAAADTVSAAQWRSLINESERLSNPQAYVSVPGSSRVAGPGEGISALLGTSDAQAIGNFMRANGLVSDQLQLGRTYFVPSDAMAYGEAKGLGQAALAMGNQRAQRESERQAQAERDRLAGRFPTPESLLASGSVAARPDPPADPAAQLRQIIEYAQIRNSDLQLAPGQDAGAFWARRAEELLTVALRYKALNPSPSGLLFAPDSIYNGLVADALQARAMAGAGIDQAALQQTAKLLIDNGEAAQAGASLAGAAAARLGRVPITANGQAHSASAERLRQDLSLRTGVLPDSSRDAEYIARTDPRVAAAHRFDWDHVLAGEINAAGKATGYHAELAAGGAARIKPDAPITRNANGTYEAPVQVWDAGKAVWVDKPGFGSTFFPADWSRARIEFEVTEAFKVRIPDATTPNRSTGTSPSGIEIRFNWDAKNQRTTFFPPGGKP